jgi:alanine racemase
MINGKEYKVLGRLGMYHAIIDITGTDDIIEGTIVEIPTIKPFLTNDKIRREYI